MACSASRYKTCLVICNIVLLFVGLSVLILSLKMSSALSLLMLDQFPMLTRAVKAVIATGLLISFSGTAGICGACYEKPWLLTVHLGGLGIIVIMEFSLGVILMVVRNTIENSMESVNCGQMCMLTLDNIVLDFAVPSAGIMMTVIILEAGMIYSAVKLLIYIRNSTKVSTLQEHPATSIQNAQMQIVSQSLSIPPQELLYPSPIAPSPNRHLPPVPPYSEVAKRVLQEQAPKIDEFHDPPTYQEAIPHCSSSQLTTAPHDTNYIMHSPGFTKVWKSPQPHYGTMHRPVYVPPEANYVQYQPSPSNTSSTVRERGRLTREAHFSECRDICFPTRRSPYVSDYVEPNVSNYMETNVSNYMEFVPEGASDAVRQVPRFSDLQSIALTSTQETAPTLRITVNPHPEDL